MKKLITLLLVLILASILLYVYLSHNIFKSSSSKASVSNSTKFSAWDVEFGKSAFYRIKDDLYHHESGPLTLKGSPIYEIKDRHSSINVSPDGMFAVVREGTKISVLDHKGKVIKVIENCYLASNATAKDTGKFFAGFLRWDPDSEFLLIVKATKWERRISENNHATIYKLDLKSAAFEAILEVKGAFDGTTYLSRDGNSLFCKINSKEYGELREFSLETGEVISERPIGSTPNGDEVVDGLSNDDIFIEFNKRDFLGFYNYEMEQVITQDKQCYTYIKDADEKHLLIKGKCGYAGGWKTSSKTNYFYSPYYLPGNKYFIAAGSGSNLRETIAIDLETRAIMKADKQFELFFNINNDDCTEYSFSRGGGYKPKLPRSN